MLRRVAFKNFLCFEDYQSLTFKKGPNFLIGANGTGKTAVFELIRRCLSSNVNVKDSGINDEEKVAFVLSYFETSELSDLSELVPAGCKLYSLFVRRPTNNTYKLVCVVDKNDKTTCYLDFCTDRYLKQLLELLDKLTNDTDDRTDTTLQEIKRIKDQLKENKASATDEDIKDIDLAQLLEELLKDVPDKVDTAGGTNQEIKSSVDQRKLSSKGEDIDDKTLVKWLHGLLTDKDKVGTTDGQSVEQRKEKLSSKSEDIEDIDLVKWLYDRLTDKDKVGQTDRTLQKILSLVYQRKVKLSSTFEYVEDKDLEKWLHGLLTTTDRGDTTDDVSTTNDKVDTADDVSTTEDGILEKIQSLVVQRKENKLSSTVEDSKDRDDLEKLLNSLEDLITKKKDPEKVQKELKSEINRILDTKLTTTCDSILQTLDKTVVITFPLRSPGAIQWSQSQNMGKDDEHYKTASKRAEILQTLLESQDRSKEEEEEENKVFQTIIYPSEYEFKKEENDEITVSHRGKTIQLLKVPEGIIEAKQFSLMFTNKKYQTLLLEEADRCMHPQMIQKLRDVAFRECKKKEIVIVFTSHQPEMIDQRAMSRLHVCRRERQAHGIRQTDEGFRHSIIKLTDKVTEIHQHQDQLKDMLFSAAVLFVEGTTDRAVIGWVFDRVLDGIELGFSQEKLRKLKANLVGTRIISLNGGKSYEKMKKIANALGVPFAFLLDGDIGSKLKNRQNAFAWKSENLEEMIWKSIWKSIGDQTSEKDQTPNNPQNTSKKKKILKALNCTEEDLKVTLCKSIPDNLTTPPINCIELEKNPPSKQDQPPDKKNSKLCLKLGKV
ncbi:glutamic acid-rich protein-like [Argopecten irradians]|uniref:glutamic acid-rich protein-like n=1 Tax=Argopecten irradians TaxID=31199 RepID=UPI003714F923